VISPIPEVDIQITTAAGMETARVVTAAGAMVETRVLRLIHSDQAHAAPSAVTVVDSQVAGFPAVVVVVVIHAAGTNSNKFSV